jgi:Carboxypeptidase regulatory-like domain
MRIGLLLALIAITVGYVASPPAKAQARPIEMQGEVRDQNGALIVGAGVSLAGHADFRREALSNAAGRFRIGGLAEGSYTLKVTAEGFDADERTVELRHGVGPQRVSVTLYPLLRETVTVDGETAGGALNPERAAGTQVLTERDIQALPDDPDQLNEQLQQLAASAGGAPGQAVVTVDGFLAGGRLPPKSAIREVRINPDLYSAEYDTPPFQGGRIEIYTKPGADSFHGSGFFNFNDSALNARNAFAAERVPTRTLRYGWQLTGPISAKRAGFFLDFEKRDIDESATVNAVTLDDNFQPSTIRANVPTPQRLLIGSARADWQLNPANTFIARLDFNVNRLDNQGVGAFDLPERAFTSKIVELNLRLTETSAITASIFNEARVGLTRQRIAQRALSNDPTVSVLGAFTSGGATNQSVMRDEWRLEIVNNLSITTRAHNIKLGAQILVRNVSDERANNFNGTFLFGGGQAPQLDADGRIAAGANGPQPVSINGLEQYRRALLGLPGGAPTRFSFTTGDPRVNVRQWLPAAFIQDEWRLRPNLSLSLGLRYEGQSAPSDSISLAPRIGMAFSPDKKQRWVIRARAGIFYSRIAEALMLEARRLDGLRQQQVIIDSPPFPDPFQSGTSLNPILTLRRMDEALRPPASLQLRVEMERQLPGGWKISTSHSWTRGWASLRSRNINAPVIESPNIDPLLAPRPFGTAQNVLQFESSGRIKGRVFFIGVNQSSNKRFNVHSGYLFFDFRTDADNAFAFPQSSYDLSGEWAPPSWQTRHRLFLVTSLNLPWRLRATASFNAASGTAFNITTGRDNNGDGNFNDRPSPVSASHPRAIITRLGVFDPTAVAGTLSRNAGTNPASATLDFTLSRTFAFGKQDSNGDGPYKLTLNVRAGNLLNRTNLLGYNGVLASPFFGRANAAGPARRIEFGLRFSF